MVRVVTGSQCDGALSPTAWGLSQGARGRPQPCRCDVLEGLYACHRSPQQYQQLQYNHHIILLPSSPPFYP